MEHTLGNTDIPRLMFVLVTSVDTICFLVLPAATAIWRSIPPQLFFFFGTCGLFGGLFINPSSGHITDTKPLRTLHSLLAGIIGLQDRDMVRLGLLRCYGTLQGSLGKTQLD